MKLQDYDLSTLTAVISYNDNLLIAKRSSLCLLYFIRRTDDSIHYKREISLKCTPELSGSIDGMVLNECGSKLLVWGSRFVAVLNMPNEFWIGPSVPGSIKPSYFCETFVVHDVLYGRCCHPHHASFAKKHNSDAESMVVVLGSDNAVRFYNMESDTALDYPVFKVDLTVHIPKLISHSSNKYGVLEYISSFCVLDSSPSCWTLAVLHSDGDLFISSMSRVSCSMTALPVSDISLIHCSPSSSLCSSFIAVSRHAFHYYVVLPSADSPSLHLLHSVSLPLPSPLQLLPVSSSVLVLCPSSIFFIDVSASLSTLYSSVLSGMDTMDTIPAPRVVECFRQLDEFCALRRMACVEGGVLVAQATNSNRFVYLSFSTEMEKTTIVKREKRTGKNDTWGVFDEITARRKAVVVLRGLEKRKESEVFAMTKDAIGSIEQNIGMCREGVSFLCKNILLLIESANDVDNNRKEINIRLLKLFSELLILKDRLSRADDSLDGVVSRVNSLYNSIPGRLALSKKEKEMLLRVKELKKHIEELTINIPQLLVELDSRRRRIAEQKQPSSLYAHNYQINHMSEEIACLEGRISQLIDTPTVSS